MKLLYPDYMDVPPHKIIEWACDWIDNNGGPDVWEGGYPMDVETAAQLLEDHGLIIRQKE